MPNRKVEWINIANIKMDSLPLNPASYACAKAVEAGVEMPPIRVELLPSGQYLIRDGRHRYVAFRLNGIRRVRAYVSRPHHRRSREEAPSSAQRVRGPEGAEAVRRRRTEGGTAAEGPSE